jgi:hypothetical protein
MLRGTVATREAQMRLKLERVPHMDSLAAILVWLRFVESAYPRTKP